MGDVHIAAGAAEAPQRRTAKRRLKNVGLSMILAGGIAV